MPTTRPAFSRASRGARVFEAGRGRTLLAAPGRQQGAFFDAL